jgi:Flp pilus assembly protein TadD
MPDDPNISDTLGWILYKRGVYQQAVTLLRESSEKLPDNPEVHYHLGMALYKLGDRVEAKRSLTKALEINAKFPGADIARNTLSELS